MTVNAAVTLSHQLAQDGVASASVVNAKERHAGIVNIGSHKMSEPLDQAPFEIGVGGNGDAPGCVEFREDTIAALNPYWL